MSKGLHFKIDSLDLLCKFVDSKGSPPYASNQAGPPGNSSPKNADNKLGSCEDSAADMEDQEACSSSSNLESPAELPVS